MAKIFGKNCIYEAIRAGHKITKAYVTVEASNKDKNFTCLLKDKGIKFEVVDKKKMDSLFPSNHQGYGAIAQDYTYTELETLFENKTEGRKTVLVLDGIEDPHNFGAMLRSADAFGASAVIIPKNRSVSITDTVAHVSTGAIEYVPVIMVNNLAQALVKLKENGYWVVGTDASGDTNAKDLPKDLNLAIVIGSEGFGMSKVCKKQCDYVLSIPMVGHVNSLNASVSCGIVLALINQ